MPQHGMFTVSGAICVLRHYRAGYVRARFEKQQQAMGLLFIDKSVLKDWCWGKHGLTSWSCTTLRNGEGRKPQRESEAGCSNASHTPGLPCTNLHTEKVPLAYHKECRISMNITDSSEDQYRFEWGPITFIEWWRYERGNSQPVERRRQQVLMRSCAISKQSGRG